MILSKRVFESETSATVRIADKAQKLREAGKLVLDFSAGRAFEPTPKYVVNAAIKAMRLGETHQTMARGTTAYRKACAKKLKRENNIVADPEKEIVATMGCKQGLTVALLALLDPGDEVIVEDPGFVSYRQTINYLGGIPVEVPLLKKNNFRWKKEQLKEAISSRTKAIIFCTPHNPTGVVHTKDDLNEIASVAIEHDLVVITDEPYERTVWGGRKHINLTTLPGMAERTITLMSLTKSFSMGGWRLGFAHANEEKIEQMAKLQQHLITCVNSFSQAGGVVAYGTNPKNEVLSYWKEWEKKVKYFNTSINAIDGLNCHTPEGGFYAWVDISELGLKSEEFCDQLLERNNVALVPGGSFGKTGDDYVRITCVKSWEEIELGLKAIKDFVEAIR